MAGHSKTVCKLCDIVMTQCRCMSEHKDIKYDVCSKCMSKEKRKILEEE